MTHNDEALRQQCDNLYHLQLELDRTLTETQKEESLLAEDLAELFQTQKRQDEARDSEKALGRKAAAPEASQGEDDAGSTVLLLLQNELQVLSLELRRETESLSLLEKSLASQCMLNDVTFESLGTLRDRIQADHQLGCKANARLRVLQAAIDTLDRSIAEILRKLATQRRLQAKEEARMADRDRAALRSRQEALFAAQIKRNEALHASTVQRWIDELRSENVQLLAIAENLQRGKVEDAAEGEDDSTAADPDSSNDWSEFGIDAVGGSGEGDVSLTRHLCCVRQPRLKHLRNESQRLLRDVVRSAELLEDAYRVQLRRGSGVSSGGDPPQR